MTRADALLQQLGPRLRNARQTANLTVRKVGERLGVDHSMIVRYENGESLPPLDRLIALADLYGLTPAGLLARHAAAVPIITAIDQAEAATITRLAALLKEEGGSQGWTVEFLDWGQPELQSQRRALRPSTPWRWLQGQGVVSGSLIGGCLEVLDWLRGTAFWPNETAWQNAILFLETSEEAPSPTYVGRVLRTFAAIGMLSGLSAILVGRPGGTIPEEQYSAYDEAIRQAVAEEYGLTNLPIITNMDFGHTDPIMVLPYGVQAQVDCDQRTITILEGAVTER